MKFAPVCLIVWCVFNTKSVLCNNRPVIGILAQERDSCKEPSLQHGSFISASYVKAVEASGARVVPVFIDRDIEYYQDLTSKLNGFVFPGGGADITSAKGYARSGRIIFDEVSKLNDGGISVPILGVCLGMELLGLIAAKNDVRTSCRVKNEALSLQFLDGYRNSSLYKKASANDFKTLSTFNSTSNHHRYCLTPETLKKYKVDNEWKILSTSTGLKGDVFVSSMEMKTKPIVAVMFHPEKNAYEWKSNQANPHDGRSIKAARLFYDWLVDSSRKNNFGNSTDLTDILIYNYNPIFSGKLGKYDTQDYLFP